MCAIRIANHVRHLADTERGMERRAGAVRLSRANDTGDWAGPIFSAVGGE